jgi:vacuolar-type H+-ATPase subunit H
VKGVKVKYLFALFLLALIILFSDFLSTDLFQKDISNFSVWFILSIFAFACGWAITKIIGWHKGSRMVFTVIVATSFITLIFITYFNGYFQINGTLSENLILFFLRNVVLGLMGIFGMAVAELFNLQRELRGLKASSREDDESIKSAKKEADIIVSKAKLDAEKIIFDAEKEADKILERKNKIEIELKEFIKIEKELIQKYEKDEIQ